METRFLKFLTALFAVVLMCSCTDWYERQVQVQESFAPTIPDYADSMVIPANIAPLNFCFTDTLSPKKAMVRISAYDSLQNLQKTYDFKIRRIGGTDIPLRKWRKLMEAAVGGHLSVCVFVKTEQGSMRYKDLHWFVSPDKIDKYLLYRVSQYEEGLHGEVYFTQRDLENFKNRYVGHNRLFDYDEIKGNHSCMNCHDCLQNNSHQMVFHIRGTHKGTILMHGDTLIKIAVPDNYNLRLTYPAWHPSGKIVAFSTNLPASVHYASSTQKIIYTLDTLGSIVLLDVEKMRLFSCPELTDTAYEHVFPTWSPDGTRLYFCRSPKKDYNVFPFPQYIDSSLSMRQNRTEQIWDDLMQLDFDPQTGCFSNLRCTYPFSQMQKSATMPKVSKNGRYLMLSLLKTSTFPLMNLGDFYQLDLQAETLQPVAVDILNTPGSEKGHSFSSNGYWMVFSSSRRTLAIPETYITHFNPQNGTFSKPFLVPQKQGDFYRTNLQGFVFPVLSAVPIRYTAAQITKTIRSSAIEISVDSSLISFKLASGQKNSLRGGH